MDEQKRRHFPRQLALRGNLRLHQAPNYPNSWNNIVFSYFDGILHYAPFWVEVAHIALIHPNSSLWSKSTSNWSSQGLFSWCRKNPWVQQMQEIQTYCQLLAPKFCLCPTKTAKVHTGAILLIPTAGPPCRAWHRKCFAPLKIGLDGTKRWSICHTWWHAV